MEDERAEEEAMSAFGNHEPAAVVDHHLHNTHCCQSHYIINNTHFHSTRYLEQHAR